MTGVSRPSLDRRSGARPRLEQFGERCQRASNTRGTNPLLRTNVPAHVSLTEADGSLVTHVMWVDYDGEHILTSSPTESYKSRALRQRPNVAVSVIDPADPWRRLSISGRVAEIREDVGSPSSTSSPGDTSGTYPRTAPREIFVITPDKVRAFMGRR